MSTAMSTKRDFVSVRGKVESEDHVGLAVIALLAGALFLGLGIHFDSALISVIGFVGFTTPMLYLNSIFWAHIMKDKKFDSTRISRLTRYY